MKAEDVKVCVLRIEGTGEGAVIMWLYRKR